MHLEVGRLDVGFAQTSLIVQPRSYLGCPEQLLALVPTLIPNSCWFRTQLAVLPFVFNAQPIFYLMTLPLSFD